MRRVLVSLVSLGAVGAALLTAAAPAGATGTGAPGSGWEPAPSSAWSYPAGARCDFAVRGAPVVDEVVRRTVGVRADGTEVVEYKGDLVVRVLNPATGRTYDADASGRALVELHPDHSQTWYVVGPILAGFAEGGGNVPRGLYTVDGAYTLEVSPTGYKTLTFLHGSTDSLCEKVA
ncbi:hypothetical protein ACIRSU_24730 [Streptomyces sp. NPDC101160]|uniref:hypothetical protein n=1 Tax=Streptomyces sp. NPDC101160 TaxID=3366118 RepID=UPI0038256A94